MDQTTKTIRFSGHALSQLEYRGTSIEEITLAINSTPWSPTELGRLNCRMDFNFDKEWNGKHYATKQVRPIFVEEKGEVVVVTVYVYYF